MIIGKSGSYSYLTLTALKRLDDIQGRSFDPYPYSSNCEQRCILFFFQFFRFGAAVISNRHIHKYIHIYIYLSLMYIALEINVAIVRHCARRALRSAHLVGRLQKRDGRYFSFAGGTDLCDCTFNIDIRA